jgi:non-specific serine/threonine protein kinase
MVTGREALFIEGEITQQIASLSLPGGNGKASFEEISSSESVQLFVTRAQEITPDMALSQATAPVIAEIVRHLDGIPLAIELAAARTRMLSFEQIADRLNDRFRLLTGGRRTALPRQRTLLAMIDWSWNLLEEKEQLLWRRLSIFSGGWSLEAAQSVASDESLDEYDIFDNLEQLVNKSLVTVRYPAGGAARYDMLESIRQYGHDRLLESGEMEALRDRHVDYFVAFADEAAPHLAQASAPWTKRINLELDNLRAALIWSLEDRPELALRIGGDLFYREAYSLSPREARSWLEPAIAKTRGMLGEEVTTIRAEDFIRALLGLAVANGIQGNTGAAVSLAEEGIQLARKFGELRYVAYATSVKYLQHPFNLPPEAMQELEEAVSISRENGYEAELGLSLVVYGIALDAQGKAEMAMAYLQEALSISRRVNSRLDAGIFGVQARLAVSLGDSDSAKSTIEAALDDYKAMNHRRGIVMGQSSLAHIYREEGNLDEAESYYRQSIVGWQELGHRPAVAHQIECLAYIAIGRGQHEHAARLLGAAGRARRELNSLSEDPQEIRDLALAMEQLGDALGEKERDLAMAEGAKMSLDDAVTVALKEVA